MCGERDPRPPKGKRPKRAPVAPPVRVCLGGTFDPFHVGHERLLERALAVAGPNGQVFVGLVSDAFSAAKRRRRVAPYAARERTLVDWLAAHDNGAAVQVRPLDDPHGPSATGDYDVLVASAETAGTGAAVNAERAKRGLSPLRIDVVPLVYAGDLLPISGTRIAAGRIDRDGRRLRPLHVVVGSANPVKVGAVEDALAQLLGDVPLRVHAVPAASGVAEQPLGGDTQVGAVNRARAALAAHAEAEYAVGIEAGLMPDAGDDAFDVQYCAVLDHLGTETIGHGSGFRHPPSVMADVRKGHSIGAVLGARSGDPEIGASTGAIGWLTDGRLDRRTLTRQAVVAAFVPRLRPGLYRP